MVHDTTRYETCRRQICDSVRERIDLSREVDDAEIQDMIDELAADKEKAKAGITGIEIAARIIKACKPYCQGVHIMALGWESKVPALLELAGL